MVSGESSKCRDQRACVGIRERRLDLDFHLILIPPNPPLLDGRRVLNGGGLRFVVSFSSVENRQRLVFQALPPPSHRE